MKIQPKHISQRLVKNSLKDGANESYAGLEGTILSGLFVKTHILVGGIFPIDVMRKNSRLRQCIDAGYHPEGKGLIVWSLNSDIYESEDWKEAEQEVIAEYMEEMEAAQKALQSVVEKYTYK